LIKQHFRAQALLEFALVSVILFLLIFGILEVGRYLFIYASIITSSREAVRYGSVSGLTDAGVLHYQDCAGIRNTARRLAFFQTLADSDIVIEYDTGPGTAVIDVCDGVVDAAINPAPGERIVVTVTGVFEPIAPLLPFNTNTIVSTSARTIMGIVEIK
jgi:Flp pilus assembly protein TadG